MQFAMALNMIGSEVCQSWRNTSLRIASGVYLVKICQHNFVHKHLVCRLVSFHVKTDVIFKSNFPSLSACSAMCRDRSSIKSAHGHGQFDGPLFSSVRRLFSKLNPPSVSDFLY